MSEPQRPRCFITFVSGATVGGIETLAERLGEELLAGNDAVLICARTDEARGQLNPAIDYLTVPNELAWTGRLVDHLRDRYRNHELVLVALHPWTLVLFYSLRYRLRRAGWNTVRCFHLLTHSRGLFMQSGIINDVETRVFFAAPRRSNYFMNEAARLAHSGHWGMDLSDFPVLQLPMRPTDFCWKPRRGSALRIVSVGRLVPFKGYNRAAPAIVRALRDEGVDATWDIWGDGQDHDLIRTTSDAVGVSEYVRLRGPLEYASLQSELCRYDVFVGMGTAILEAAQIRMPSICAIEGTIEDGYGFLHEAPEDSVGDVIAGAKQTLLIDTLRDYAGMDEARRMNVGEQCRTSAERRSRTMQEFSDAVRNAEPWPARVDVRSLALLAYVRSMLTARALRNQLGSRVRRGSIAAPSR